jgi:hypothetical protein
MAALPFAASFDALAHIVYVLRVAGAQPACDDVVPALCVASNSCAWDPTTKQIIQNIPYEHYRVGWYPPGDIADAVEVQVFGRRIFIHPESLERLAGKRLVLKTLDKGQSNHPGFQEQLLVAAPLTDCSEPSHHEPR